MRYANISLALALLTFAGWNDCACLAGPQSVLDPYAHVQAPRTRTLRTRRSPVERQRSSAGQAVSARRSATVTVKESGNRSDGGFIAGIASATRKAGVAVVKGPVAAGQKVAAGSRAVGNQVVAGSKRLGESVVSGAGAAGDVFARGAGSGLKAAGSKIAGLPAAAAGGLRGAGERIADGSKAAGGSTAAGAGFIGHGLVAGAVAVKDGAAGITQKVVAGPAAMGRSIARLLGQGEGQTRSVASQDEVPAK